MSRMMLTARSAAVIAVGAWLFPVVGSAQTVPAGTRIVAIEYRHISPELERRIQNAFGLQWGDLLPDLSNLQTKVKDIDTQLSVLMSRTRVPEKVTLTFFLDPPGTLRISSGIAKGLLQNQVRPVYPASAKELAVQGIVQLEVVIDEAGRVEQLSVEEGPEMLRQAAMDAVRQWTFRPYLVNRQPTKIVTEIEINFSPR